MKHIPIFRNPMAWRSEENWTRCVYCNAPWDTEDHVPPKCLFDGRPQGRIVVPACHAHNKGRSKADEAFRDLVAYHTGRTPETRDIWDRARRARPRGPMPDLARLAVLAQDKVLEQMGDRLARALYWHEYGEKLPLDTPTQATLVEPDDNWRATVRMMNRSIIAKGQFMYAYRRDPRHWASSVWFFVFQHRLVLMALTGRLLPEPSSRGLAAGGPDAALS